MATDGFTQPGINVYAVDTPRMRKHMQDVQCVYNIHIIYIIYVYIYIYAIYIHPKDPNRLCSVSLHTPGIHINIYKYTISIYNDRGCMFASVELAQICTFRIA